MNTPVSTDKEELEYMKEFVHMGENTPNTKVLDEEAKQSVLEAIANADITEMTDFEPPSVAIVDGDEFCAHCLNEFSYSANYASHIVKCPNCGKYTPLCSRCENNGNDDKCGECIYCDLANFYNYLNGSVTIEKFLSSMIPPLTDMTSTGNENIANLTYDDFINDTYGDKIEWDVKYWEIYGKIKNCMLSTDSAEESILGFVEEIIADNKS